MPTVVALIAAAACSAAPPAQCIDGDHELLHEFTGQSAYGEFGNAVAGLGDVDGDGVPDFVIGALHADPAGGASGPGAAFVHSGASGAAMHRFDGVHVDARLGAAVAGPGDVNGDGTPDVLVGAPREGFGEWVHAGAAFVYDGATGSVLHRFDGSFTGGELGSSVAGAGDVDGDGHADLIVGAPLAEVPGHPLLRGAVVVYSGATGAELHRFHADGFNDGVGYSVSAAGDVDGDGHDDVAFGAPGAHPLGMTDAGSVFVHSGATGAKLLQIDGIESGFAIGDALALTDDLDGDGVPELIVGGPSADFAGLGNAGFVSVHSGATGEALHRLYGRSTDLQFGTSVAGAGDVDGDGIGDLLIGAIGPGGPLDDPGEVSLYSGASGNLVYRLRGTQEDQRFGAAVAGVGDVNGDGRADVLIGARGTKSVFGSPAGAASVYAIHPFLRADRPALSVAAGGIVRFTVDFPDAEAGRRYALLGSLAGQGPQGADSQCLPLIPDALTRRMATDPPRTFTGTLGILSNAGNAMASLRVPPGVRALVPFIGTRLWFAAYAFDGNGVVSRHSSPVPLDVVP